MKKMLLGVLLLITFQLFAQENSLDSLNKITKSSKDTINPYIHIDSLGNVLFTSVQIESEFDGGANSWRDFIINTYNSKNISKKLSRKDFKEKRFEQTAELKFTVCSDGSLCDFQVTNDVHPAVKEEALRIIRLSPKWKPGMQNGVAVRSKKRQRITFQLEL